jgi:hypothetical protein
MSGRFLEQGINIKFCTKLRKNSSDACAMLSEDYGGEAMKKSSVFIEWHKGFRDVRENVNDDDDERSGRPKPRRTDESTERVWNLMHLGRCLSIRAMAMQLNLDKETVACLEEKS